MFFNENDYLAPVGDPPTLFVFLQHENSTGFQKHTWLPAQTTKSPVNTIKNHIKEKNCFSIVKKK